MTWPADLLFRVAAAALPPVLALAVWGYVRRRRAVGSRLGDRLLLARLAGEDLLAVPWRRVVPVLLAGVLLGAALLDPRWGEATEGAPVRGGAVVLVLDASSSMLVEDLPPNRLEAERAAARELLRSLPGTPAAVVVFAGRAYALVPPTVDRGALDLYLEALHPSMVTQSGSSLAAAVRQGVGLLAAGDADPSAGALVLVSDGDAREGPEELREAVALARRAGVRIHTLGAGTAAGAPVPDIDLATGERLGVKREPGGEVAVSRLNEELLREVAASSGGSYAALSAPGAVEALATRLQGKAGTEGTGAGGRVPRYPWFAAGALLLLLGEALAGAPSRRSDG